MIVLFYTVMYVDERSTERLTVHSKRTYRTMQPKWAYESNGFPLMRHNYICYPVTSIIITGQTGLTPGPVTVVQKHSHGLSGNITYMLTFYHDNDCILGRFGSEHDENGNHPNICEYFDWSIILRLCRALEGPILYFVRRSHQVEQMNFTIKHKMYKNKKD